jgi:hypothetical protein
MQNLKRYKNFKVNEGFIDDIFSEAPKEKISQDHKMTETNTSNLMKYLSKKIEINQSSPIYIFNDTNSKYPVYIMRSFFESSPEVGSEYSYCILNGAKEDLSNISSIKQGLYSILSKNSSDGKSTIIEISNISANFDSAKSEIFKMILGRKVSDYSLKDSEFFVLTDNSNSSRGGKNLKDEIALGLKGLSVDLIYHKISDQNENSEDI